MSDKSLGFNALRQALEEIYSQKVESSAGSVSKKKTPQRQSDQIPDTTTMEEVQSEDVVEQVVLQTVEGVIPVPPPMPDESRKAIKSTVLYKSKSQDKIEHQGEQSERIAKHIRKPGMMSLPPPPTEDALKKALATLAKVPTNIPTSIKFNLTKQPIKTTLRATRDTDLRKTKFEKVKPTDIEEENIPKAAMLKPIPAPILEKNEVIFKKPLLRKTNLLQNKQEVKITLAKNVFKQTSTPSKNEEKPKTSASNLLPLLQNEETNQTACENVSEKDQMTTTVDHKYLIPIPPPMPIEKSLQPELLLKSTEGNCTNQTSDQSKDVPNEEGNEASDRSISKDVTNQEEVVTTIIPIPSMEAPKPVLMIATQHDLRELSDDKIDKKTDTDDYESLCEEILKDTEESTPLKINIPIPPPMPVETPKQEIIKLNELPDVSDDKSTKNEENNVAAVEIMNEAVNNCDIITNVAVISIIPSLVMETSTCIDESIHPPLMMVASTSSAIDDVKQNSSTQNEETSQKSSSIDANNTKKIHKERRRSIRMKSRDTTRTSLKYKKRQKLSMYGVKPPSTELTSESVTPKKVKTLTKFFKNLFKQNRT